MAKSLLSMALMMTQLLSWSASPLYLCLSEDGSFCVDLGPENCKCCKHSEVDADGCAAAQGACKDHDHSKSEKQGTNCAHSVAGDPCDCTHIQISQTQGSTLVSSSISPDAQRLVAFLAACDLVSQVGYPPIDETKMLFRAMHFPPPSLTASASAVMRC